MYSPYLPNSVRYLPKRSLCSAMQLLVLRTFAPETLSQVCSVMTSVAVVLQKGNRGQTCL
jgi:hypothetical protein